MKRKFTSGRINARMNSLRLLFLLFIGIISTGAGAQVLINENFSSATGSTPPAGWANVANGGTTDLWRFDNPGSRTITGGTPGFSSPFAIFDSDNSPTTSGEDGSLITPEFDASQAGSYRLEFDHQVRFVGPQTCEVDVWNGSAWVNAAAYNTASVGYTNPAAHATIDISVAAGSSAVSKVRFHYVGNNRWWWAIDNVSITRLNCVAPAATFTIVPNCANNQYSVNVSISNLGSATSVAITEGATTFATATTTGNYSAGPFANGTSHTLTLVHTPNTLCNVVSPALSYYCPPANDNCTSAVSLVQGATCSNTAGTTVGASQSLAAGACSGNPDDDVWYSFEATAIQAQVNLSSVVAVVGISTDMYFQVLSGTCLTQQASLLCSDPNSAIVSGLAIGQTYYVRVYTFGANNGATFNICVNSVPAPTTCGTLSSPAANATVVSTPTLSWSSATNATAYDVYLGTVNPPTTLVSTVSTTSYTVATPLAPGDYYWYVNAKNNSGAATGCAASARKFTVPGMPANDNCANAISLTPGATCINTAGTTVGATQSMAATPCFGNPDDDVWYSFVATATDVQVALSGATAVIGTSTDMYFQILSGSCNSMTSLLCNDPNTGTVAGLVVGQTYYIRVYTYSVGAGASFNICLTNFTAAPTACATLSSPAVNATTAGSVTFSWTSVTGASAYDLYLDGANPPVTIVTSTSNTSFTVPSFLAPGVYYWYVVPKNSLGFAMGCAANARKLTVVGPPANDLPTGAITIMVDSNCTAALYTNLAATLTSDEPRISCKGSQTAGAPVWFKFVAPASGFVRVSTDVTGNGLSDTRLAVYATSRPEEFSSYAIIACDDDNGSTVSNASTVYVPGLTPGVTYYIAVDDFTGTNQNTFCLQVHNVTSAMVAPSGSCTDGQPLSLYAADYTAWLSLTNTAGQLIANTRSNTPLSASVTYTPSLNVNTGAVRKDASNVYYLDRNYRITNSLPGNYDVQFYFLNSELSALQAVAPATTLGNLNVTRVKGESTCSANFLSGGAGNDSLLLQAGSATLNNFSWVRVRVPGFSNYYLHSGNSVLPISIQYIRGVKTNAGNAINWKVNCTSARITMNLERSADARNFAAVTSITADRARCNQPFDFTDIQPGKGINYYRLKMIDIDGSVSYSAVVAIINADKGIEIVGLYPTMVSNQAYLSVAAAQRAKLQAVITDITGKRLQAVVQTISAGSNLVSIDCSSLASGVYNITGYVDGAMTKTIRFTKL